MSKFHLIISLILFSFLGISCVHVPKSLEDIKKGVVKINSNGRQGTGFVVKVTSDTVYILTVVHVIKGDPNPIVKFFENQEIKAKTISAEESDDNGLALLLIENSIPSNAMSLYVAKESNLRVGDSVFTFGFPRGGAPWSYDELSYAGQEKRKLTFSGSDIEEGNSGGPIIKGDQVVGILTEKTIYAFAISAQGIREFLTGLLPKSTPVETIITPP